MHQASSARTHSIKHEMWSRVRTEDLPLDPAP